MHRTLRQISFTGFLTLLSLALVVLLLSRPVIASDQDDLAALLNDFLANVTSRETHDRFWAEDLIYTSSRGTRTTKADILSGFTSDASAETDAPGPVFSAEDVQIRLYGNTAVVAFRLVATPPDDDPALGIQNYLNTGTFLKRDGIWQAVAWQATIVPGTGVN